MIQTLFEHGADTGGVNLRDQTAFDIAQNAALYWSNKEKYIPIAAYLNATSHS